MRVEFLNSFLAAYDRISPGDKERVQRAIQRLGEDWRHPGLHTKRMQGTDGIWEARASLSLRITFELSGDKIVLRNVGTHDDTLKNA